MNAPPRRGGEPRGTDIPPPILVRHLGPDDVALLRAVNALFGEAFEDRERYGAAPPSDAHLGRLLRAGTFIALAGFAEGRLAGALAAYELVKFERETSEIYLYDLAVAEAHRRRGVARALIGRLHDIAAERRADTIFVQADAGDEPALALYGGLGIREDVHHFDIPPGAGGADEPARSRGVPDRPVRGGASTG